MAKIKGAGSYQEVKLSDLNKIFQPDSKIVVNRRWIEQFIKAVEIKPIESKQKISIQDPAL